MSQARLYYTKKTRKEYTCTKCWEKIEKGSSSITFAVGFRGSDQRRHNTPECTPKASERESSMLSEVYAAQESVDLSGCTTTDEFMDVVTEVAEAARNVASEYESNEMYEINYDLQERAEALNYAADTLESITFDEEEPDPEDEEDHEKWVEATREQVSQAIMDMELP